MYLICFNVPVSHVELVKEAVFEAGAGRVDNYSKCAWQVLGEGQFMPLAGSRPFLGIENAVEKVQEYKVETVCEEDKIEGVIAALKLAHPYEVPSYQVWALEKI
ncbi:MAG: NGG1p interacting factor NIF3 [Gammaproteobacteria bacterium]|nr:NGG1p interacting factor NIF3 [Gammaproteobacteria bacterium]